MKLKQEDRYNKPSLTNMRNEEARERGMLVREHTPWQVESIVEVFDYFYYEWKPGDDHWGVLTKRLFRSKKAVATKIIKVAIRHPDQKRFQEEHRLYLDKHGLLTEREGSLWSNPFEEYILKLASNNNVEAYERNYNAWVARHLAPLTRRTPERTILRMKEYLANKLPCFQF